MNINPSSINRPVLVTVISSALLAGWDGGAVGGEEGSRNYGQTMIGMYFHRNIAIR